MPWPSGLLSCASKCLSCPVEYPDPTQFCTFQPRTISDVYRPARQRQASGEFEIASVLCAVGSHAASYGARYDRAQPATARKPIGAITSGAFSLSRGHGFAIGCVSMGALADLPLGCIRDGVPLGDAPRYSGFEATVLVRDVNSLQYRFAVVCACTGSQFLD